MNGMLEIHGIRDVGFVQGVAGGQFAALVGFGGLLLLLGVVGFLRKGPVDGHIAADEVRAAVGG